MKTTLSKPTLTKTVRKTPTRRKKTATVETVETTLSASPTEAAPNETVTATEPAPAGIPPALIPSLTATFGAPLKIIFRDLDNKEVVSEVPGDFTLAKRLAMAYAAASRTTSSYIGVACGDLTCAFTIIAFDPKSRCVTACLATETPTMKLPCADPKFTTLDSTHARLDAPERSAISQVCYGDLPRVSTTGDCPHCGEFVSLRDFIWRETSDAGERQVAQCSFCSTMMKKRF